MTGGLAYELTRLLGGDWHGSYGTVPAPGHSKRDRSLSIKSNPHNPNDVILHSFAGEQWKTIKDELRRRGILLAMGWRHRPAFVCSNIEKAKAKQHDTKAAQRRSTSQKALWVWRQSLSARGTVVEHYLRGREIEINPLPDLLRYLPPKPPRHPYPAMVAPFGLPVEREPGRLTMNDEDVRGVHLTYLDGIEKAPIEPNRKMLGACKGMPIVLAPRMMASLWRSVKASRPRSQRTKAGA